MLGENILTLLFILSFIIEVTRKSSMLQNAENKSDLEMIKQICNVYRSGFKFIGTNQLELPLESLVTILQKQGVVDLTSTKMKQLVANHYDLVVLAMDCQGIGMMFNQESQSETIVLILK